MDHVAATVPGRAGRRASRHRLGQARLAPRLGLRLALALGAGRGPVPGAV